MDTNVSSGDFLKKGVWISDSTIFYPGRDGNCTVSLVKVFVCSLRKKTKPDFFLWPNLLLFFATNLLQEKLEFTECHGALKVFSGVSLINGSGWFSAS